MNIFPGQIGISIQQIAFFCPFAQFAQGQFNVIRVPIITGLPSMILEFISMRFEKAISPVLIII